MDSTTLPAEDWTPERLQSLITDQIPEDFRRDYKGADALPLPKMPGDVKEAKRADIGKDVTAFANSDGGVIIYGIREASQSKGRAVPERFDPVSTADVSRDQLAQLIAAHSEPTLVGVRVLPVQVPGQDDVSQVCYVVAVPKSDTAHMASDGRYYYRNEATTERMRDWQVRDAMNRRKYPDVVLEIEISPNFLTKDGYRQNLQVRISNVGKVIARSYCAVVHFPLTLNDVPVWVHDGDDTKDHHIDSLPDGECYHWIFSNRTDDPLFPGRTVRKNANFQISESIEVRRSNPATQPSIQDVRITLFADEMPAKQYRFVLKGSREANPLYLNPSWLLPSPAAPAEQ